MAHPVARYWNPTNLLAIWRGVRDSNYNKLLAPFFPYKRTVEEKVRTIKGYKNTNVILNLCDPDAKRTIRGARKLSFQDYEIPEFSEGIKIYASELREISRFVDQYGHLPESLDCLDQKYIDYLELMNGVGTNAEYFRAELLQYGKFQFRNRTDDGTFGMIQADFDADKEWANHNVYQAQADWEDPADDILADVDNLIEMFALQNDVQNDGKINGLMIMNSVTWARMKKSEALQEWLWNMRSTDPMSYFRNLGLSLMIDNQGFQSQLGGEHVSQTKFIRDGNVCLIPNMRLGNIICSESDLFRGMMRNQAKRPDVDYDDQTGTVVRTVESTDPDTIKTTIEAHIFPAFDKGMFERCCVLHPTHKNTRVDNTPVLKVNGDVQVTADTVNVTQNEP